MKLNKLVHQTTDDKVFDLPVGTTFYLGIDPTGPGLHLGHLIPIKLALQLVEQLGWKPIILIGGMTALTGDPTGRTTIRKELDNNSAEQYSQGILFDVYNIFGDSAIYVNNIDWLSTMLFSEYFDITKHILMSKKLSLDVFKTQFEQGVGLTMNQFLYPDMQAIDFIYLYRKYNCKVQIGGRDQWGNISFGTHLTNKIVSNEVFGICSQLIEINGQKLGKSLGAVPISQHKEFYQYMWNLDDNEIQAISKFFIKDHDYTHNEIRLELLKSIFILAFKDGLNIFNNISNEIRNKFYNTSQITEKTYIYGTNIIDILKDLNYITSNTDFKNKMQAKSLKINNVLINNNIELAIGVYTISFGKKNRTVIEII